MKIPFAPPRVDDKTIAEVVDTLNSGWITTGPKTAKLEEEITAYTQASATVCLNSATAGLELMLRWFGVQEGDEVIVPAYTYCATANVVEHVGATPVMVDVNNADANINLAAIEAAISDRTKVIVPVDIAGMPCDYCEILALALEKGKALFQPRNDRQKQLGRPMVMADAAHSFGALYGKKRLGSQVDAMVFSFHAVKNLTTAEGGAVCLNFEAFNNHELYAELRTLSLHGQSKDAFKKMQPGAWRYDVAYPGYKCNMTDLQAAIGLVELARYDETLNRRKEICNRYIQGLADEELCLLPEFADNVKESSYHLFRLRIKDAKEADRDKIITILAEQGIATNVHFLPLPMLSYYKNKGYDIKDYPNAYNCFANEISLPVYFDLTDEMVDYVVDHVKKAVQAVMR
ncbi:DegT/DnrJ/EryC1/StrS family aminotransferase [Luteibaculum oceani]|uniref:DegT/DnrJ/EryC1/StrS family aminotransferase n=1 Tax=Luteibaculum oceani TaxID=1294296 RepID=A0A5C6UU84_9FLAO|nr:DegT/DnrJ/EryC1/StrS family aminotransferase [Luteibaculum oceani]TXC76923.1 DegT/DnrJ/EryC1/StrS family aminotransferase [Luteibaculum oceani]